MEMGKWKLEKRREGTIYRAPTPNKADPSELTVPGRASRLGNMVVHLKPETESRLQELAAKTGRAPDELVEDAMSGYLAELAEVRNMLDGRYEEIKSGRVQAIEGEEAFARLREKGKDRRGA